MIAWFSTRSMIPRKSDSAPIGSWIGTGCAPRRSIIVCTPCSKSAPMRSILLMKAMRGTWYLSAWRQTVSDCGSTPATESNSAIAPSSTRSERSTSTVKSTWPGVSMMLIRWSVPLAGGRGGGDRDAALLLLLHPVHDGGALVDLADLVGAPGVEQDALSRRRLTGVDVGHDPDVAGVLEAELAGHLFFCSSCGLAAGGWSRSGRRRSAGVKKGPRGPVTTRMSPRAVRLVLQRLHKAGVRPDAGRAFVRAGLSGAAKEYSRASAPGSPVPACPRHATEGLDGGF